MILIVFLIIYCISTKMILIIINYKKEHLLQKENIIINQKVLLQKIYINIYIVKNYFYERKMKSVFDSYSKKRF